MRFTAMASTCFTLLASAARLFAQAGPEPQAAPSLGSPTVSILSPSTGSYQPGVIEVTVAYAAGQGRGNHHVTQIDVLLEGSLVGSSDIRGKQGSSGTITLSGIDVSAVANTGNAGIIVARAFQGNPNRGNFSESSPISIRVDTLPPSLSSPQPPDGTTTASATLSVSATWQDDGSGSGVNPASAAILFDGVAVNASTNATGFIFNPAQLAVGSHTVVARVNDLTGNSSAPLTWSFTVVSGPADTTPPVVTNLSPAPGSATNDTTPFLTAQVADAGGSGVAPTSVVMLLNAIIVPSTIAPSGLDIYIVSFTPSTALSEGENVFRVEGEDLAGNPAVPGTSTFIIDVSAPTLLVTSPLDGAGVGSLRFSLAATTSDGLSGLKVSETQVELNGFDITSTVNIVPGSSNPYGFPTSASLQTSAVGSLDANLLVITVHDQAGNSFSRSVTFTAMIAPLPPSSIVLVKVSGDGQEGLAGRCSAEPIVVRAIDTAKANAPVRGLQLDYSMIAGAGGTTEDLGFMTSSDGSASFKFVFGARPGVNTIRVGVIGRSDVQPVEFGLTTRLPSLTDVSQTGTFNCYATTSEYAGSALSKLLKVRLRDHKGSPIKGEEIVPIISSFKGQDPPTVDVGNFLPSRALTDANGETTFAFIINRISDFGPFTMRFMAPAFVDSDNNHVKVDIAGAVLDPQGKPGPAEINYTSEEEAGQSQVGLPGHILAKPLRTKGVNAVLYFLIEGAGEFLPGPEGTLWHVGSDPCGSPFAQVNVDSENRASIRFKPTSPHALIQISGVTDVFAVGPPEVHFIRATDNSIIAGFAAENSSEPDPDARFRVEAFLPVDFSQAVTLDMASYNASDNPLDEPDRTGEVVLQGKSMAFSYTDSLSRYARYVSMDTFSGTDRLAFPGDDVASIPAVKIQTRRKGTIRATVKPGLAAAQSAKAKEVEITTTRFAFFAEEDGTPRPGRTFKAVFLEIPGVPPIDPKDPAAKKPNIKWTITRLDGPAFTQTSKAATGTGLVFSAGAFVDFVDATGVERDPVKVPVALTDANRRAIFKVSATGPGLKIKDRYLPVNLGKSLGLDNAPAPPTTRETVSAAHPQFTVETNFGGLAEDFGGLIGIQFFIEETGTTADHLIPIPNQRLTFTGSLREDKPTLEGLTVEAQSYTYANLAARAAVTLKSKPIAVGLYDLVLRLDATDLKAVVTHEYLHVQQMNHQTPKEPLFNAAFEEILQQLWVDFPGAANEEARVKNLNIYLRAADTYKRALHELEAARNDVVNWATTGDASKPSVFSLESSLGNLVQYGYFGTLEVLFEGVTITQADGVTMKALNVTNATKNQIIAYINDDFIGKEGAPNAGSLRALSVAGAKLFEPLILIDALDTSKPLGGQRPDASPAHASFKRVKPIP